MIRGNSLEHTYKGLKYIKIWDVQSDSFGLEHTYKGLKFRSEPHVLALST